jgi:IclR family KDG regulon transcriptional repressor
MVLMIKSVKKATEILTVISDAQNQPVNLESIAAKTKLNKSTCVHILSTFCETGFVQRISHREGYKLGPLAYYLTRYGRFQQELIQVCHPVIKWLNQQINQTTLLTIICEDRKFIIYYIEGKKKLAAKKSEMILGDIYATATGRVLMAYMSKREVTELCNKRGFPSAGQWPEAKSMEELFKILAQIRRDGYVFVRRKLGEGYELGYACEIHDEIKSLGAVGVAVSAENGAGRSDAVLHQLIINKLRICSREINRRIRFNSPAANTRG